MFLLPFVFWNGAIRVHLSSFMSTCDALVHSDGSLFCFPRWQDNVDVHQSYEIAFGVAFLGLVAMHSSWAMTAL